MSFRYNKFKIVTSPSPPFSISYKHGFRAKRSTDMITTIKHFAFKSSLAFFKFMKVKSKYLRSANSNDVNFKTDVASLKCNASSFKIS